jgi:LysM repeat protein
LHSGEFPYCIARRFNVDPGELLRINGLTRYSVYFAGMNLRIPQTGRTFPGKRALLPHPTTYTVRAGDTIYTIACSFGDVDPNAILQVNPGISARPAPGTVLQIP